MRIGSVEIYNILSIKEARIEFNNTGLVLIEGFNYDDDTANGAGKSAIMNALSFGLYGKFPRNVTISSILRHGTQKGHVIVNNIYTNGGIWRVERCRPTAVKYFKDDIEQDISQQEFENKLGLTYSQFLISMYSAQTSGEKFIDMNDTSKKDFLLRLMNLDEFALIKATADNDAKIIENKMHQLQLEEASLISRIQVYLESNIDVHILEDELIDIQNKISKINNKINKLQTIQRPDISQFDDIIQKIALKRNEISNALFKKNNLSQQFNTLANNYKQWKNDDGSCDINIVCPECNKEVRLVDNKLIGYHDIEKLEEAKQVAMSTLKEQCKELKNQIDEQDAIIAKKYQIDELETKIKNEKINKYHDYDMAQDKISEYKTFITQQNTRITTINNQFNQQDEREKELKKAQKTLDAIKNKLQELAKELELTHTVAHIYSSTGAPAYIMDSIVDAFNESISNYVNMIWPNASYSIQVFKENKDGSVKAKFSDKLILNGRQVSIGSLSGGQHRCLSLAIDFAILDILSDRFSIEVNPVIFDEPLAGLDVSNKERVLEVLDRIALNRQIIIIEHSSEFKSAFTKTIRVELRNGISIVSA